MVCLEYTRGSCVSLIRYIGSVPRYRDLSLLRHHGTYSTPTHQGCIGSAHKCPTPAVALYHPEPSARAHGVDNSNLIKITASKERDTCHKNLVVLTLNARSVKNKTEQEAELILEKDIDVCAITETWLSGGKRDSVMKSILCPDDYKLLDVH